MSKCEYCHGAGKIKTIKLISAEQGFDCVEEVCTKCNGSGEHEQTNEEWLRSASTEQLAECLTNISFNTGYDSYSVVYRKMVEWLKQPHTKE